MSSPRRPVAIAVVGLAVALAVSACGTRGSDVGRDVQARDTRGGEQVDCAQMLAFLATATELPGDAWCRRTTGIDTLYEAQTTAHPDDVDAWLADVHPAAVLGDTCAGDVDRCVQVVRDPQSPGAWHVMTVDVTGTGSDAAVHVAAFDT
ncbi:hypothetical protein [Cellulomonas xiejunii]|uniref:hypothetical protein n=1 Tax=Cellulomonas xiejunii TaxID=2968083 RepID=UPI001D0E4492|nr:hypothetical protein [Cellulomonas xiejunii]MCC2315281.1 hypothetical protein [Cellulomonas xiejunii]